MQLNDAAAVHICAPASFRSLAHSSIQPPADCFTAPIEAQAAYYSRRAREEVQAAHSALCRKSRQVHQELASAYEFRAHLLTAALQYDPASQLCALTEACDELLKLRSC